MAEPEKRTQEGVAVYLGSLPKFRHDDEKHDIPLGQVVLVNTEGGNEWAFGDVVKTKVHAARFDVPGFKGQVFRERNYTPGGQGDYTEGERFQEICLGIKGQLKMIVVGCHRDCDGTPLYVLSFKPVGFPCGKYTVYDPQTQASSYPVEGRSDLYMALRYSMWCGLNINGISVGSMTVCEDEFVPLQYEDIYEYEKALRPTQAWE